MTDPRPDRRAVLRTAGLAAALTGVAGCLQRGDTGATTDEPPSTTATDPATVAPTDTATPTATETETETETETTPDEPAVEPLTAGGSSSVYPIVNRAAAYWNANPAPDDDEYWPHAEYGIETDQRLADYWAGQYGFPAGERADPPFPVTVGLSHSGRGLERLREGRLDLANASVDVAAEKPGWSASTADRCVDHVVGVDGVAVAVSGAVHDAGVTELTGEELAAIYRGETTNWAAVGGPDREVEVYGRAAGSGTGTVFAAAVLGDADAETAADERFQQGQRLAQTVAASDAGIGYVGIGHLGDGVEPVDLTWAGTTYAYGDDEHGLGAADYPLARDLHVYSWDEPSPKEAAVLRMLLSAFGQAAFVAESNYITLPADRRERQREALPAPAEAGTGSDSGTDSGSAD